jgi:hypothetical protein
MREELGQLAGRFSGTVTFLENPAKRWEMVIESSLRIEKQKLHGTTRILLSENGKVFSNLDGNGDQGENYRNIGDAFGMLVKASPTSYFQLYFVPRLDAFIGNYYEQVSPDRILPRGSVRLERG